MPCSNIGSIENGIRLLLKINPESVLDVGIGFGMWGFLVRQYLDVRRHHQWKDIDGASDWKVRLDGVEAFHPYLESEVARSLYDRMYGMTAKQFFHDFDSLSGRESYDVTILSHVLEHMPVHDAHFVVHEALLNSGNVLIGLPLRHDDEGHEQAFNNPHELHTDDWTSEKWNEFLAWIRPLAEMEFIEEGRI